MLPGRPRYEGAFTVDATPALRHPEEGIWIPEQHNSRWVPSDPEYLNDLTAARHAKWNQFAKLVRVLKRWNADHGAHMKSLVVEVLALDHLPIADRPVAVARFFAAAQETVWSPGGALKHLAAPSVLASTAAAAERLFLLATSVV